MIQVSVPSGNPGHMGGWDAGPRSKAPGLFSQISNPGHQSQPWGAGSFRRPGHRTGLTERAPAPPCQPGLPSDKDRGSRPSPGRVATGHTLQPVSQARGRSGRAVCGRQEAQAWPRPGSRRHSLGLGCRGLEGTPRGTRGFIFWVPAWSHSGGSGPNERGSVGSGHNTPRSGPAGQHRCPRMQRPLRLREAKLRA